MTWTIELWGTPVADEIDALPQDIRAKLERLRISIEQFGPMSLPPHYVKHVGGGLWEFRLSGRDGIARILYIAVKERRVVLLHAFIKKTQRTPLRDLELARHRARTILQ